MKGRNTTKLLLLSILSLVLLLRAPHAYAAGATMSINPNTGSYKVGNAFSVDLVIDGKGESFNAAKATVDVSSGLQINNLILGDCQFSFITTPTTSDPSFVGAILGSSSQRCTLYTLDLTPIIPGSALITLSDASIKRYGDAKELLQSVQNGTYELTGAQGSSSQQNTITTQSSGQSGNQPASTAPPSTPGTTTLIVKAVDSDNTPIVGATVLVNPASAPSGSLSGGTDQKQEKQSMSSGQLHATTDASGIARIANVPPGIHTIEVKDHEKPISSNIVNIAGNEPIMTLGMKEQKEAFDLVRIAIIIIIILLLVGFVIIFFRNSLFKLFQRR